jgi:hypothetical protein
MSSSPRLPEPRQGLEHVGTPDPYTDTADRLSLWVIPRSWDEQLFINDIPGVLG